MNGYVFFYNERRIEISAASLFEAKQIAIAYFNPLSTKTHMVHGMLAEKDGEPVIHTPDM